jgi:hypothetical protein
VRHGRVLFQLIFLLGALLLAAFGAAQEITVGNRAREIQNSAIVIDTHEDTPQRFLDENYDIASTDPKDPEFISLDKARAGNLGALFFSIWVNPQSNQGHFAQRTLRLIDSVYAQAERHPDRITISSARTRNTNWQYSWALKVDTLLKVTLACSGIFTALASDI